MRIPEPQLQRVCACGGACSNCQTDQLGEKRLQTKAAGSSDLRGSAAPAAVHEALITCGQPLDPTARGFFEPRLGVDLANVRIHSDVQADAAARAVHARAFTLGPNVVFGQGQYQPHSDSGRRLIAHELAHVVQQSSDGGNGALSANVQRAPGDDPNAIQSYVFAGDKKLSTDKDFARRKGQEIAARIPQSGEVSWDDRLELSGMLQFFQAEAKEVYIEEVQRARVDPSKEIQMPAEFARPQSYVFGGDKRLSTDEDFARRSGQKIAIRIRTAFQISWDDRLELNGMLAFFEGQAKEAYIQEIKPALVSLEPPPKKFVDQYREQTVLGPRWEIDRLASHLSAYVARHASPYAFIRQVFDEIPAKLEDNIAAAFVELLQEPKLDEFAATSEGRTTLDILYEAIITGDVSDFQRKQAQRILQAKMRRSRNASTWRRPEEK